MIRQKKSVEKISDGPSRMELSQSERAVQPKPPHPLLELQRTIGNQTMQALLRSTSSPTPVVPSAQTESASALSASPKIPSIVHDVLRLPGEPVDVAACRCDFDFSKTNVPPLGSAVPRALGRADDATEREAESVATDPERAAAFVPDLAAVRVHTGTTAAAAAAAVEAAAFTVGNHIVFGAGRYDPISRSGQELLVHELVHVAQSGRDGGTPVVRRRSLLSKALVFLGLSEGEFDNKELADYLAGVTKSGKIEDKYDSDNKARAIVRRWMTGNSTFQLAPGQMVLLIREMDTGYVGGEDQDGILDLLTHAQNGDLRHIFEPGQINPKRLESDFGGKRKKRLLDFYDTRFRGGKLALYGGTVEPLSGPGPGTPLFAWNWTFFRGKLEDPAYGSDELAAELSRLIDAERDRAFRDISGQRIVFQRALTEVEDKAATEADPAKRKTLRDAAKDLEGKRQRVDTVIQTVFKDIAKAEPPTVLLPKTHAPTAPERAEIKKALKPDVRTVGGVPAPFVRHIVGEAKSYDDKIRDLMPTMIQGYWDDMVKDKEAAQHSDPTKVHKLDEFDSIANAAKDATDKVFGAYYSAAAHPAFRSDRPPPVGRGQLHDLWADIEADLAVMGPAAKRKMAKALVFYFFQSNDDVTAINRHHNADPEFKPDGTPNNTEATVLNTIATAWVTSPAHVKKLNEIDRNWDASADPATHEVNLQIFKKPTAPEDRFFLWDMYQTLIHEYLHTLADPAYGSFADSFGRNSLQNNTLIEGVDSLLDEIVWQDARSHVAEPTVRAKVEGPTYSAMPFDPKLVPPVFGRRYASYTQAVKLVNVVGIRNLYAAYFKGRVDLIRP
jgi:hypothetical protein